MPQQPGGAAVVIPIVTDHTIYAPAARTMLDILRNDILPVLRTADHGNPANTQAHHSALEIQSLLAQIDDVERQRRSSANKKNGQSKRLTP